MREPYPGQYTHVNLTKKQIPSFIQKRRDHIVEILISKRSLIIQELSRYEKADISKRTTTVLLDGTYLRLVFDSEDSL